MYKIAVIIIDYTSQGVYVKRIDTNEEFYVDLDFIHTERDFTTLVETAYVDSYNLIRKVQNYVD